MVAVDDEVCLLHGVAGEEVGADALPRREPFQVVQVVHTGRQRDLAEMEVTIVSLGPKNLGDFADFDIALVDFLSCLACLRSKHLINYTKGKNQALFNKYDSWSTLV